MADKLDQTVVGQVIDLMVEEGISPKEAVDLLDLEVSDLDEGLFYGKGTGTGRNFNPQVTKRGVPVMSRRESRRLYGKGPEFKNFKKNWKQIYRQNMRNRPASQKVGAAVLNVLGPLVGTYAQHRTRKFEKAKARAQAWAQIKPSA